MSRKWFLYLCAVLAILLSSVVTPLFQPAVAVAASPDAPSNVSPSDGAADVSLTPTLQSSGFSDPDLFDGHAASQWQITASSGDYSSPVFDSDRDRSNLTRIVVPSGILDYSTTYYWHVRHRDNHRAWSEWSAETSFVTTNETTAPVISDVNAIDITENTATIVWTTNERATSRVEYGVTNQYGLIAEEDTTLVINHSVNLTGLARFTTYHYRVKSADGSGNPTTSADYFFTTPDGTAPSKPVVSDDGASTTSVTQLHASWSASDPESGIAEYQYAIGTTAGGNDVVGWTSTGNAQVTKTSLNLTVGVTYYFSVKAKNGAGLWSGVGVSDGIAVVAPPDTIPPTTPVVADDGASTTSTTQLHASWSASDDESGIAEYQYAIGTTSGGTNVVAWTSAGTSTQVTKTGLSLTVGTTYYFSVKAKNGQGLWSSIGKSDGIKVVAPPDTTPPTTPVVTDDGATTTGSTQLLAAWSSNDPESGIAKYQYAIGTTFGGTDITDWTSVSNTQVTKTGLSLAVGSTYYFSVKARNGIGLWSAVGVSDGIVVIAQGAAQEDISQAGGTVQTAGGKITAEFPADAVVGTVTVSIKELTSPSGNSIPQGFKAGNTYFVMEVTDVNSNAVVTLSQPVVITVKYSEEDLAAAGGDPGKLVLAYYDEAAKKWKPLDTTVNTNDKTLSATTTHLSTWTVLGKTTSLPSWLRTVIVLVTVLAVGMVSLLVVRPLLQH